MPFECLLLPEAEKEYLISYTWYEDQQAGLGEKFAVVFRKKLTQIADNPLKYKIAKGVFRELSLANHFLL